MIDEQHGVFVSPLGSDTDGNGSREAPFATVARGVASAILSHLLDQARAMGWQRVSLETGSQPFFAPARALYARHGFEPCGPFEGYGPDPASCFMTLRL